MADALDFFFFLTKGISMLIVIVNYRFRLLSDREALIFAVSSVLETKKEKSITLGSETH